MTWILLENKKNMIALEIMISRLHSGCYVLQKIFLKLCVCLKNTVKSQLVAASTITSWTFAEAVLLGKMRVLFKLGVSIKSGY